jgi:FkbM family methyltransferase
MTALATHPAIHHLATVSDAALAKSLATIGRNDSSRAFMVEALRAVEKQEAVPGLSVRDRITGPLIDALHSETGTLSKTLANGLTMQFVYRSKIAREFVMSPQAQPDHVWEPQTTRLLLHLARDVRHVIVGGAYMGDHAVLLANQIQPHGGTVHAFEPNPEQAGMLSANMRQNGLKNLSVKQLALWCETGLTLRFSGDDAEASSEIADGDSSGESHDSPLCESITIDDFCKQCDMDSVDVLMLDIEGGELNALRGAEDYLSQPPDRAPRIVFEIHSRYSDWSEGLERTDIVRLLRSFGYHVFAVRDYHGNLPMGDKPIELIPPEQTVIAGPPHGFNMLAVKRIELVQDPMFRMCSNVSPKLLPHKDPALHGPLDGWA